MKIHELDVKAHDKRRRSGRGIAAGRGKTAGRGTKGQNARSGGGVRPGFEGGQNPLLQRLPKAKGFVSRRAKPQVVTTAQLDKIKGAKVTNQTLKEAGLIEAQSRPVKIVARGTLRKKVTVQVHHATKGAIKAIQTAGGSFEALNLAKPPKEPQG